MHRILVSKSRTEQFLLLLCFPLALLLISPLFHIILRASEVELQSAIDYFSRSGTQRIILRSLLLVVSVSVGSCVIAVPSAWLTTRTTLVGRRLWTILLILPVVIPTYVGAFAFIAAVGEKGALQSILESLFGVERLPSIYGFWGAWLSVTFFTYPYVYLSVRAGLQGIDPALEESGRVLGQSAWTTFWRVTLPQLRPFILGGALLVALYTLGEFGAVSVMQYDVFSRAVYFQLNFDRNQAALLSLALVFFTLVILLAMRWFEGQSTYYTQQIRRKPRLVVLGRRQQALAQLFCGGIVLVALVIPTSVVGYWLVNGLLNGAVLRDVFIPLQRSLRVSALAAGLCGVVVLPFVFLQVRFPSRRNQLLARSPYLGYAIPGVVIGLALTFFGARYLLGIGFLGLDNYRIIPLLIFAYAVRFASQALGPTRAALLQVNPHAEESAMALGRSRFFTFWAVTLPLMRSGIVAGVALVFLTTMKELPTTLMLAPAEYDTLATRIWSATEEAFYARAALPALILVGMSALSLVFILEDE